MAIPIAALPAVILAKGIPCHYSGSMRSLPILVLALAVVPHFAHGGLPQYDPEGWCRTVASSGGGFSRVIMSGCLQQEQKAYDDLVSRWDRVPSSMQSWCDRVANSSGSGSYVILFGCVKQEEQAGQSLNKFQFRR